MVELRKRSASTFREANSPPLHGRSTRAAERAEREWSLNGSIGQPSSAGAGRSTTVLPAGPPSRRHHSLMQSSEEDVLGNYDDAEARPLPTHDAPAYFDQDMAPGLLPTEDEKPEPGPSYTAYEAPAELPEADLDDYGLPPTDEEVDVKEEFSEYSDDEGPKPLRRRAATTRSGRTVRRITIDESDDDLPPSTRSKSKRVNPEMRGFVENDDVEDGAFGEPEADWEDPADKRARQEAKLAQLAARRAAAAARKQEQRDSVTTGGHRPAPRQTRNSMAARADFDDEDYQDQGDDDSEENYGYRFRNRKEVNYKLPTMEELAAADSKPRSKYADLGRSKKSKSRHRQQLPFNMSGAQLSRLFGEAPRGGDSSDDDPGTPRKRLYPGGMTPGALFAGAAGSNMFDLAAGTPSNLGRISGATNLADTDPLLPSASISFESVGGLDEHIQQLKEMVSLPLLYPEVFRRFNITPPRGVLFHGPPGTGKTLLARALAASCSSQNQKISFFMRKGADCLSKWVGEAERQLRLLFEEARASQPSIIFFDEIDGLAPVRSSKQEQIHASIVSTLLALMDGMDGRGQVIVIGATNRPDAIDPALRRPGRFDREFYFPLPNVAGRRKILEIHTGKWEPPLPVEFLDELAGMTKGYGGADLRALCTEAALNAVQRRYPQIYKSNDRLLIKPETIDVKARDFVIAAKKLIPSSTRATSSLAAALPSHLEALLQPALDKCKEALASSLPESRKINVLEEAEYEEDERSGGFEREQQLQAFEAMRVHRPRLLVHGPAGMGQATVAAAVLHHLEGFHVQSLDLGNLVSDSSRTPEAACVQLFTEARRHKPSILFIPSLLAWSLAVTETVKATVQTLLDGLEATEPVLLFAISEVPLSELPADVRAWFGLLRASRVVLEDADAAQRDAFFAEVLASVKRPPTDYPDAAARPKRILEELPKAPPPPPRQPTAAELELQLQTDQRLLNTLKFLLGPILSDLKRRYKRFTNPIGEPNQPAGPVTILPPVEEAVPEEPIAIDDAASEPMSEEPLFPEQNEPVAPAPVADDVGGEGESQLKTNGILTNGVHDADDGVAPMETEAGKDVEEPIAEQPPVIQPFIFHDMDLDQVHEKLYYDRYFTPSDFMADIALIVENAEHEEDDEQRLRALQMQNHAQLMVDQTCDRTFQVECAKAAMRFAERRKLAKGKARQTEGDAEMELEAPKDDEAPATPLATKRRSPPLDDDDENADEGRAVKRARFDLTGVSEEAAVGGDGNFEAGVPSNAVMDGIEQSGSTGQPLLPRVDAAVEAPRAQGDMAPIASAAMTAPVWPPAASQQGLKEHFVSTEPEREIDIDEAALASLASYLRNGLGGLNVEHLEQLRAAMCDLVWRARKSWDKRELVSNLQEVAEEVAADARLITNVSNKPWKKQRLPKVPDTSVIKPNKSFQQRREKQAKLQATKAAEDEIKAEQEASRQARIEALRDRRAKADEKARIAAAAQKMSAKRLQRFKKRLGRSKQVAH